MARYNKTAHAVKKYTHEGAPALTHEKAEEQLLRAVATCLLGENTYYESGVSIMRRIADLSRQVDPSYLAELAVKARTELKLRSVPLYLLVQLAKRGYGRAAAVAVSDVVLRPDQAAELLTLWWKEIDRKGTGKTRIPHQFKRGLGYAFQRWDEYQLAKWQQSDKDVTLRDVLFLVHPKPTTLEQAATWKALVDGTLESPDTWEVSLSAGKDKKETWTRLLEEDKLGYVALLKNLRNMDEAGVDGALVNYAIKAGAPRSKSLPIEFVAAARFAPRFAKALSDALDSTVLGSMPGNTAVLIDNSGSMHDTISQKSKMEAKDAGAALGVLFSKVCPEARIFSFGTTCEEVQNYGGLAIVEAVRNAQVGHGTNIGAAVSYALGKFPTAERIVVVTDGQSMDPLPNIDTLGLKGYIVVVQPYSDVASVEHGGKGGWHYINGFSDRIVDWIAFNETGKIVSTYSPRTALAARVERW